jgi:hypothetical protein
MEVRLRKDVKSRYEAEVDGRVEWGRRGRGSVGEQTNESIDCIKGRVE